MAFNLESIIGGSLGDAFQKIVGAFKTNPTVALQVQTELEKAQLDLQAKLVDQIGAQIEVDKAEAQTGKFFVAGWRPAVGWVCAIALMTQFLINPLATWGAALRGYHIVFPTLDLGSLMTLLFGMLGMGGMRTYEKLKGVQGQH